jgi:hypothetical protein
MEPINKLVQPEAKVEESKEKDEKKVKDKTLKKRDVISKKPNISKDISTTSASSTTSPSYESTTTSISTTPKPKDKSKTLSYLEKAKLTSLISGSKSTKTKEPSEKDVIKSKKSGKTTAVNKRESRIKGEIDIHFSTADIYIESDDRHKMNEILDSMKVAMHNLVRLSSKPENKQLIFEYISDNPNKANTFIINLFKINHDVGSKLCYTSFYQGMAPFMQLCEAAGHEFKFASNQEDLLFLKKELNNIADVDNMMKSLEARLSIYQLSSAKTVKEWEEGFSKIPNDFLEESKEEITNATKHLLSLIQNIQLKNPEDKYTFKINDKEEVKVPKELVTLQATELTNMIQDYGAENDLHIISNFGGVTISDDAKKQFFQLLMGIYPGPAAKSNELHLLGDFYGVEWIKLAYRRQP